MAGFNLDMSGVVGLLSEEMAVSAMATVHVYKGRKWLGWYNQPGSYEIAKRYGQLSRSRFWDALYPGANIEPAVLFGFDGTEGPKFMSSQSGTFRAKTAHVARLFVEECKDLPVTQLPRPGTRRTTPGYVTIAYLTHTPLPVEVLRRGRDATRIFATIPILASLGACVECALMRDWFSFAIILLGMVSNGLSCLVIATGTLKFKHPDTAQDVLPGDGVLGGGGNEVVVLKGSEGAVNAITSGQFTLDYDSAPHYHNIGICSLLLTLQFLVQLLLIPQSSLRGQLLFLATLCCSWVYNFYLDASVDRENIQRAILRDQILQSKPGGLRLEKYELGTRTAMVTFALLLLAPAKKHALERVLNGLLPNDTDVWLSWKREVLDCIEEDFREGMDFQFRFNRPTTGHVNPLLETLYEDAVAAADMYGMYRRGTMVQSYSSSWDGTMTGQSTESVAHPKDS